MAVAPTVAAGAGPTRVGRVGARTERGDEREERGEGGEAGEGDVSGRGGLGRHGAVDVLRGASIHGTSVGVDGGAPQRRGTWSVKGASRSGAASAAKGTAPVGMTTTS